LALSFQIKVWSNKGLAGKPFLNEHRIAHDEGAFSVIRAFVAVPSQEENRAIRRR
jgi:hypothetical protein